MHRAAEFGFAIVAALTCSLSAADWPQWRGPRATGVAEDTTLPLRWSATQNITLRETGYYLGRGFATIVKTIDPGRMYVGGEITLGWDLLASMVRDGMREQALTRDAAETAIRVVQLTEHPRLRGAAALVLTPAFAAPTVA